MKMMKCKQCGETIKESDKFCPNCGAKNKNKKNILIIGLVIVWAVVMIAIIANSEEKTPEPSDLAPQTDAQQAEAGIPINDAFDPDGYQKISAELLYEYGEYEVGEKVITVIEVEDISGSMLKAETENNSTLFFSITCEFSDKAMIQEVEEGDKLTVAGTVASASDTVEMKNCELIGLGEIETELLSGQEQQREHCEQLKKAHEEAAAQAIQEERDSYISECEDVPYEDVSRNPDQYDGKKIKISGEVIQVSEGWFDGVTLRIDCGGDTWYVTYTRSEGEGRILEGDYLTAYGACSGVESYTSVLGAQVTIPSMEMKYYELN